jgi:hypothetical protein
MGCLIIVYLIAGLISAKSIETPLSPGLVPGAEGTWNPQGVHILKICPFRYFKTNFGDAASMAKSKKFLNAG